jgi:beta-exotoxin I transport system permease protein
MRPSVTLETLRGQRRSLLVWSIALAGLIAMYVAVYPSVEGSGSSFSKLIEQMPDAYKALFTTGGGIDFSTPAGYLNVELFTFMGPIVVLLYAISSGAGAIAGEEDRRTLELLLVNAVGRRRVLLEKFAALAAGVTCLVTALWLALLLEGRVAGMDVPVADSAAALGHLGLLGIEFGSVALLVGALTGQVGLSRGVAAGLAVVAYLVNALAPLVGWLEPIRKASPFFQYLGHDPLRTGVSVAAIAVAAASTAVLVSMAVIGFERRDVR